MNGARALGGETTYVMPTRKAKRRSRRPRQYSLVRFDYDALPVEYHSGYPFTRQGVYVFLGVIPNMPGHCVVIEHRTGRVYSGFHTEHFVEIPKDET